MKKNTQYSQKSFDDFLESNKDLLNSIPPLSDDEREELLSQKGARCFSEGINNLNPLQKVIYFAKKNNKCVDTAIADYERAKNNSIQYFEKVLDEPKKKIFRPKLDVKNQLMDYDVAKSIFWHEYLKNSILPKKFEVDSYNEKEIEGLLKYFIQDQSSCFDLKKGICLIGGKGTGKSVLMKMLSMFTIDYNLDTSFKFISMLSVRREIARVGIIALDDYLLNNICFDEIAFDSPNVNGYGNSLNLLDNILHIRYDRFSKRVSRPTHYTSNLDFKPESKDEIDLLHSVYDERAIDRIGQMCNFVYLGGGSRR